MNIEHRGIRITDLPADLTIETNQGNVELQGVSGVAFFSFTPEQATEIRDALTEALKSLGAESANPNGPWANLREVPASIDQVYDRDGDRVRRNDSIASGWDTEDVDSYDRKYSPYTLTRP